MTVPEAVYVTDPRPAHLEAVQEAVDGITRRIQIASHGGNVRTCGVCGCLCRTDEACPKCRADLVGPW